MSHELGITTASRLEDFLLAPVQHPEILPTVLPLIVGAFIIELYFGKYRDESLGWNSSVANAVIWVATGINLLISGDIKTTLERNVVYLLIIIGGFIAYMDFFHKWSPSVAFRASSVGLVYPLAYVTSVIIKTGIPVTRTMLEASAIFIAGSLAFFHLMHLFEKPARDTLQGFS